MGALLCFFVGWVLLFSGGESLITLNQYAGAWLKSEDFNDRCKSNATELLKRVNLLLADYGLVPNNPTTQSQVSGALYGGFRPQACRIGATNSAHKEGSAVDVYDPQGLLSKWLTDNPERLIKFNLYREHPSQTLTWAHLTMRAPNSQKRTFYA